MKIKEGDSCYNGKMIDILKKFQELEHIGDRRDMGITSDSKESDIWKEKVADIEWDEDTTFVSVATGMGYEVTALLEAGVDIDQITIIDHSGFGTIWETAGFEYHDAKFIEEYNEVKKFDVCLMNPPYSMGKTLLYPKFFEKALEIADEVHVLQPYADNSNIKQHMMVRRHMMQDPVDVHEYFPSVALTAKIHYIKASKSVRNFVEKIPTTTTLLTTVKNLYPNRDRLSVLRGNANEGNRLIGYLKIHSGDEPKMFRTDKNCSNTSSPWLVLVNRHVSVGRFNGIVADNRDVEVVWSGDVFGFEVNTKREGTELLEWLRSDEMIDYIKVLMNARKTYAISKAMIQKLPCDE